MAGARLTGNNFKLTYVAQRPGDHDGVLVEKEFAAITIDRAQQKAENMQNAEPEGTLIDHVNLVQIGPIMDIGEF